jgi:hypothetical protein
MLSFALMIVLISLCVHFADIRANYIGSPAATLKILFQYGWNLILRPTRYHAP